MDEIERLETVVGERVPSDAPVSAIARKLSEFINQEDFFYCHLIPIMEDEALVKIADVAALLAELERLRRFEPPDNN